MHLLCPPEVNLTLPKVIFTIANWLKWQLFLIQSVPLQQHHQKSKQNLLVRFSHQLMVNVPVIIPLSSLARVPVLTLQATKLKPGKLLRLVFLPPSSLLSLSLFFFCHPFFVPSFRQFDWIFLQSQNLSPSACINFLSSALVKASLSLPLSLSLSLFSFSFSFSLSWPALTTGPTEASVLWHFCIYRSLFFASLFARPIQCSSPCLMFHLCIKQRDFLVLTCHSFDQSVTCCLFSCFVCVHPSKHTPRHKKCSTCH